MRTVSFQFFLLFVLFSQQWHKVSLSVYEDRVMLYVDCASVQEVAYGRQSTIPTDGLTHVRKMDGGSRPVPVSSSDMRIGGLALICTVASSIHVWISKFNWLQFK